MKPNTEQTTSGARLLLRQRVLDSPSWADWCIAAIESEGIKTIRAHVASKTDFIISHHETHYKSFQQF